MSAAPAHLTKARNDIVSLLRRYKRTPQEQRTALLRRLAEKVVAAREHFLREDGTPDWKGSTYAYRIWLRDCYADAGYSREEQASVQAAVRYHVGAVLRERLDEEALDEYGLMPHSPRERSQDRRTNRSALLSALTARDMAGGALIAISTAFTLLSNITHAALDDLPDREATVAAATLADIEQKVRALRRHLETTT